MPSPGPRHQTLSFLRKRFDECGLRPDSRHGQNFLIDLNLVHLLAESAQLTRDDVVLEVGTGTGSLTAMMAEEAGAVVSVEIDGHLHQMASEDLLAFSNVTLLHQDALRNKNNISATVLDTVQQELAAAPHRQLKLAANLPYNVATPLISNLLLLDTPPVSMTVTIQKELADRIVAVPATKDYGALSVWVQAQCRAEVVRVMPPEVFWPRPKVTSAIIQLVLEPERRAAIPDLNYFHDFGRAIFFHRRKFLRSVAQSAYKHRLEKAEVDAAIAECELDPTQRAEELHLEQILTLCEALRKRAPDWKLSS
jgi:16S rRNA (adenine1518-N6/adenine1519-N6)-dimethyltransferase